jgi:hypothetical protein
MIYYDGHGAVKGGWQKHSYSRRKVSISHHTTIYLQKISDAIYTDISHTIWRAQSTRHCCGTISKGLSRGWVLMFYLYSTVALRKPPWGGLHLPMCYRKEAARPGAGLVISELLTCQDPGIHKYAVIDDPPVIDLPFWLWGSRA